MAKIYRVEVAETVYHTTYIEAESEAEATTKIEALLDNGECSFEELAESDNKIGHVEEVEAGEHLRDYRGDGNSIARTNAETYEAYQTENN